MKIVFAGTSEFAVPALEALLASEHDVVAVVTQPDRPKGRGRGVYESPVKRVAMAHGIPVLQPEKLRAQESIDEIKSHGPVGALVVVAYGQIVPQQLLDWPEHGPINVHGSILPKYRGAAPIQHAIMMGEQQTGVTTMFMNAGLDTGDILLQDVVDIGPEETAGELSERLAIRGADLLIKTLEDLEAGRVNPIPQDDELASVAPSLPRRAGAIDWSAPAEEIANRIRGCTPRPGAFTAFGGKELKIWRAKLIEYSSKLDEPGVVLGVDESGILVAAGTGSVLLREVQSQSKQRMAASDFARGAHISTGAKFDIRV